MLYREHWTLAKECFYAHSLPDVVYSINYLWQDKSIVVQRGGLVDDRLRRKFVAASGGRPGAKAP